MRWSNIGSIHFCFHMQNQNQILFTLTQPRKKGKTRSFNNWSKIDTNSLKAVEAKILLINNVETLANPTFFDIWRKVVVAKGYWILFLWQEAIPFLGRITDIQCYFNPKYFTTQKFHSTFRLETKCTFSKSCPESNWQTEQNTHKASGTACIATAIRDQNN